MIVIIKHIATEGPARIGEALEKAGYEIQIVEIQNGESLPDGFDKIEAVLSLGGPLNVNEENQFSFLKQENLFIQNIVKKSIPFLGICLGAQLLAKACEAKVLKASQRETGWFKVDLTKEGTADPLFLRMQNPQDVFHWHGDTFKIPEEGILLATAPTCKNQAFKIRERAYGLQFHIEVTEKEVCQWPEDYKEDLEENHTVKRQNMIDEYHRLNKKLNEQSRIFCDNFIRIIEEYKKK